MLRQLISVTFLKCFNKNDVIQKCFPSNNNITTYNISTLVLTNMPLATHPSHWSTTIYALPKSNVMYLLT